MIVLIGSITFLAAIIEESTADAIGKVIDSGILGALLILSIVGLIWMMRYVRTLYDKRDTENREMREKIIDAMEKLGFSMEKQTDILERMAVQLTDIQNNSKKGI